MKISTSTGTIETLAIKAQLPSKNRKGTAKAIPIVFQHLHGMLE